ncbi:hypothetical protein ACFW04_004004 [Cataglyphis niger]
MIDNGNSTDPPVPPRRTKRKNKSASIVSSVTRSDATETTNDDARSRQKCPLQPPLSEKCRWNESRSVENRDPQCDIAASCSKTESVNERFHRENCNADIATDVIEKNFPRSRDDDTISAREIPPRIDKANDDLVPAESAALKPPFLPFPDIALPKRRTLDKYPPLFFTLHDFEDVMSAAWDGDKSASSATLENKTSTAQILDDEDDISFRVTTTNLPFGKCLGRWKDSFDNDEFIEKLDYYRLDNNKNKSDRTNVKRLSNYDSSDNDYRTGTKVRFVIDSSPSKHNGNIKFGVPSDNLQSCESIFDNEKFNKQSIASFAKLSEIREEFTDVKDCGDNLRDKLCASSAEKRNTTREYDPFMITDTNKVDMKLKTIPQTHYDNINDEKIHKEDSNFISRNERVSNENLRIGNENMTSTITKEIIMNDEYAVIDQSGMLDSSKITASVCCFTDKSLKAVCSNAEEANAAKITHKSIHQEEEISLKKSGDDIKEKCIVENEKTFVNESLLSFLNNRDDDKSSILTNNFTNESFRIEDTRRLSTKEHKEKSDFVDSKYNREEASSSKEIFAKSVPVKIRRNSFLETMLSDDLDTSINCAISTKTVVSSMSMNKELSISNESANKIRESDITKKNEHVCNFYNKTTKVDTENQEDTIKTKKKIIKVSSADIKSMQSENKNACNVKSDVLNELLCNFSNIKLKIVSPENKKSAVKIDDDKNIARSIAMDNGISKEKEGASKSLERFKNEVCDISISAKITGINNNMAIDKKIAKQDLTEINIEKKLQELENNTYNLTIGEILKNKNTEVSKFNECCNIKNKTVNDQFIEKTIDENISNIRTEEICVKTRIEETSEGIKNADEVKQDKSKKLRDICVPKTILKNNSAKCEQQQMNKFQKRIPIGAPATMNKIFDSKEFESIAVASRSLENKRKFQINLKQTHSHSKEKTDEVITVSETDDDQRRVANRSTLALLDDTMSSDDKCAIARKTTSIIPCNNNDNNKAVTPVVNISNDQSFRDVVTITPGKVRSFVKYYEIRGDATTVERHSKSKDKEKVIKRKSTKSQAPSVVARNSQPEAITEGKETIGGSKSVKSNNIHETSFNKNQFSTFIPKASADDSIYKAAKEKSKVTKGYEKSDSRVIDKKTRAPLTKTGAKKSVQFLSGFTVIHSGTFDENDSTEIVTDDEVNTLKKRRAPGIPSSRDSDGCQELIREIKKSEELPDAEKSSFQQREAIAQIHAVTNHGKNSGINCFVSKPKTPQLIFYCTV